MKKFYFIIIFCLFIGIANAQIINFPDPNFKSKLLQANVSNNIANFTIIDTNYNGEIEVNEIEDVTFLDISNGSISDLTGLSYFNLFYFDCSNNNIITLVDLNQQNLLQLDCSNNQLSELLITTNSIEDLFCSNNLIESIDLSSLGLVDFLDIHNNKISSFVPPQYINYLNIRNNSFNGFLIPNFTLDAVLVFGNNTSDQLIYNSSWRAPKELYYYSDLAIEIDLSNVPVSSFEYFSQQPTFNFIDCNLLTKIKLNNNLASTQNYGGSLNIINCNNLNSICGDVGEVDYFNQRLLELNLSSQVFVSSDCQLKNSDFEFSNYFSIYPNPAKNTLNIKIKNSIEVSSLSIYNNLGQLIMLISNVKDNNTIDVSNLKTGNYFIKLITDKAISTGKFIKD